MVKTEDCGLGGARGRYASRCHWATLGSLSHETPRGGARSAAPSPRELSSFPAPTGPSRVSSRPSESLRLGSPSPSVRLMQKEPGSDLVGQRLLQMTSMLGGSFKLNPLGLTLAARTAKALPAGQEPSLWI
jgi:hypothetical protein